MCLRCQNRGLGVCPIPPRYQKRLSNGDAQQGQPATRINPVNTIVRNDSWEEIMTDSLRENLTAQGRMRLSAAGFSCLPPFVDRLRQENETSLDGVSSKSPLWANN